MKTLSLALVAALLLSLVAIANGYPLVYSDTGTYLTQALELEGSVDRPPYYGLLIFPLYLPHTLWLIPFAQGLFISYLIIRTMESLNGPLNGRLFLGTIVCLLIGSSLPWFSSQIMPDLFAPASVLLVFILAYHRFLAPLERWFIFLMLVVSLCVHFTHFTLAFTALAGFFLVSLARPAVRPRPRALMELCVASVLAICSFVTYNFVLLKRPMISPMGPIFILARSLENGPAREYLRTTCPDSRFLLCNKLEVLPGSADEIVWSETSPLQDLYRSKSFDAVLEEAREILRGTFLKYPLWQSREMLKDFVEQLVLFRTGDFNFDFLSGRMKVTNVIHKHFPSEYSAFVDSAQVRKSIPLDLIGPFHVVIASLGLAAALVTSLYLSRRKMFLGPTLFAGVMLACATNAFLTGALAAPINRYGSRMIWLVPFVALLEIQALVSAARSSQSLGG